MRSNHPLLITLFAMLLVVLSGCMSTPPTLGMPGVPAVRLENGRALPPDCAALRTSSDFLDAGERRPTMAFGCATYTNLAAMLARPADLTDPLPFDGSEPTLAANAVRRYEAEKLAPLPATNTSNVNK
ncbi:CpaD family pilus assembly lipoprotein [Trinickia fusca]|uniref:Uncharacterized protein n=1 Tax=Trinickia fusca TaxID=2419777 RepID=A0A494XLJ2_9BURK|nr:CpaD family pilus assembly lipoprotein [Trinickia fusca]RKP50612.1 hypothetical protein D7S89_05790 [Trinickia fusca]